LNKKCLEGKGRAGYSRERGMKVEREEIYVGKREGERVKNIAVYEHIKIDR
jgi:hypothetical protein